MPHPFWSSCTTCNCAIQINSDQNYLWKWIGINLDWANAHSVWMRSNWIRSGSMPIGCPVQTGLKLRENVSYIAVHEHTQAATLTWLAYYDFTCVYVENMQTSLKLLFVFMHSDVKNTSLNHRNTFSVHQHGDRYMLQLHPLQVVYSQQYYYPCQVIKHKAKKVDKLNLKAGSQFDAGTTSITECRERHGRKLFY